MHTRRTMPFARPPGLVAPDMYGSGRGVDSRYISSGAYRTVPYPQWVEEQRAAAEGDRAYLPPVDRDGIPRDLATMTRDPDAVLAWAKGIVDRAQATDEQKARLAALDAQLGDEFKTAMTSGDGAQIRTAIGKAFLAVRDTDPNIWPTPAPVEADWATEFGTPIDTTELIVLCEEVGLYNALPEHTAGLLIDAWKELTASDFASGCNSIAFPKGACPEDQTHSTTNNHIDKKHIGVKKTLAEADIRHTAASIAAGWGINMLVGGFNDQGLPGELDTATMLRGAVASAREKEMRLGMINVLNGWDDLLVNGDVVGNPLEFDGITNLITAANGARACPSFMTGTFSASHFDQFIAAGCAHPQAILGHPAALQALCLGYMANGYNFVQYADAANVVPGIHFANQIMTGIGPVALIGDTRFPRIDLGGGNFRAILYPVRLTHNGEELIYKATQIPLAAKDLTPGCTAVAFEIWAVTALVVKAMCAQALCEATFSGIVDDGCTYVHPCTPALLHAERPQ